MTDASAADEGTKSPFVISAEDLKARLGEPDLKIVDGSFYLPAMNRDAEAEFLNAHIPGAVRFNIDDIAAESELAHMLAGAEVFAEKVGKLGISDTDTVVVYDGIGLFSAARVWLNFRIMGVEDVLILDGGMRAWEDAGFPTERGPVTPKPSNFIAKPQSIAVDLEEMRQLLENPDIAIADARPHARFTGEEAEPREGMRSGHMPGAISVPLTELIDKGRLKTIEELEALFRSSGIFPHDPVVTTCGSGVTAAAIDLALRSIGHQGPVKIYDGSWSEWGVRDDTPVATGESGHGFKAHVTYLEMTHAPARTEPMPRGLNLSLLHAPEMSLAFYRFLQREVGDPWNWVNRRRLDDEQLSEIIHADTTELSVLYYNGSPAGFFEIDRAKPERPDIAFFGLMPRATGLKLGRWFLSQAIEAAWSEGEPNAITVQTCTADHPAALPLYQKLGFSPVGTDEEMIYPLKTHERMI